MEYLSVKGVDLNIRFKRRGEIGNTKKASCHFTHVQWHVWRPVSSNPTARYTLEHIHTPAPPFSGVPLPLISFYRSIESNRFPPNCWYSTRCTLLQLEWGNSNGPTTHPLTAVGISNRGPNGISVTASVLLIHILLFLFEKLKPSIPPFFFFK